MTPPITIAYLWQNRTAEKKFHFTDINFDPYLREVRRGLFTHMFAIEPVSVGRYEAFCRRYHKEGGMLNKTISEPKFDACGSSRHVFNHKKFFARYPACYEQVKQLRKMLGIVVEDNFF